MSSKSPSKKGKSKRAHVLVAAVERATANFVERGQQIAAENPEIQRDMMEAVQAVQASGDAMSLAAREFAADPCSSAKRGSMVRYQKLCFSFKFSWLPAMSIFGGAKSWGKEKLGQEHIDMCQKTWLTFL